MSRRVVAPVLGAVALLLATGCSGGDGSSLSASASTSASSSRSGSASTTTTTSEDDWGYPALVPRQAQLVVCVDQEAVAKAVAGGAVAAAGPRIGGPAAEMLAARLKVAAVRRTPPAADSLTVTRLMVTRAGPWPRWFVAAGSDPISPTPVLRVYVAASAREPYALWAQLSLVPGVTLAEPADGGLGARVVAPDADRLLAAPAGAADRLVATPDAVAAGYAALLTTGRSPIAFGDDPLRSQVAARSAKDRAALAGSATVTSVHAVVPGSVRAMRLVDGSVLVVAAIRQTYRVALSRGTVTVDGDLAALAGRASFASALERRADEVVAFVVPTVDGGAVPSLVAAAKADVGVSGS